MSTETTSDAHSGPALCLSGGGFRATLFHLGAIRRLNELGVLSKIGVVTSVSGGSVLNGRLAVCWSQLQRDDQGRFTNFDELLAQPLRDFCGRDLRTPLLVGERLNPLRWPHLLLDWGAISGNALARAYQTLFQHTMLSDLPAPIPGAAPRFVFCATCFHTGACWHFHGGPQGRMGDFYSGYTSTARVSVAEAVAASSAFPPAFAALRLRVSDRVFTRSDPWGTCREPSRKRDHWDVTLARHVALTDGGVYDNLGVEPIWDRSACILVSDAGRPFLNKNRCSQAIVPRLSRTVAISMEQVGAVRKRWFIERIRRKDQLGAFWGLTTPIEDYGVEGALAYGTQCRPLFAAVRTDFNAFTEGECACLENHGYTLADAAIRSRAPTLCPSPLPATSWPYGAFHQDTEAMTFLKGSANRSVLRDLRRYLIGRA
jgi:NTE family protein